MAEEKQEEKQEQTPVDYQEQLQKSEFYKLAGAYGIDLSGYKADSEDAVKAALDEIKKATKEIILKEVITDKDGKTVGLNTEGLKEAQKDLSDEEKKALQEAFNELIKPEEKNKGEFVVEQAEAGGKEDENQDLEWVKKKKEIWKNFAKDVSKEVEEKEAVAPVQYSAGLKDVQGRVDYTSEKNAAITKDADFLLYQGLVRDAAKSNLNIKIGDTLTGAQKLMLYAAVLSSSETYPNGEKLSLIGAPQIDPQSPDYQSLPDDVKKILAEELKKQQGQKKEEKKEEKPNEAETKKQEIEKKLSALKDKLQKGNISADERYTLRQEQLSLLKENLPSEELAQRKAKELERDKIMAARLGITGEYHTKKKDGTERIVTKDETLIKDKNRVSDEVRKALAEKSKSWSK